jgi:plastocyanin
MRRTLIALAVVLLVAAGCGKDNEVGSSVDLNNKDQAEDARLGESTTTTAPAETGGGDEGKAALGETTTTEAPTTTVQAVTLSITINSDDSSGTQFDPAAARVYVGSLVEWVNKDTVARSVVADNGAFDSGAIPPGGTFRYSATTPGQISYTDGTRPYAIATLEVIPR